MTNLNRTNISVDTTAVMHPDGLLTGTVTIVRTSSLDKSSSFIDYIVDVTCRAIFLQWQSAIFKTDPSIAAEEVRELARCNNIDIADYQILAPAA